MARRRALTMAGAAGDELAVNQVLHRFGYDAADVVASPNELLGRLRQERYDLVIVAVDQMDPGQITMLERELRREPGTNGIATASRADSEVILTALRAGLHEFLVRPPGPNDLNGALDRLTRRVPANGNRGSVIAVYSAKGGVGVTTTAVNLAFRLGATQGDQRVALVDLVVGAGDIRMVLNLKSTYDINDLVARESVDADVLFSLLTERGKVWVLPSSEKVDALDLDSSAVTAVIAQLRQNFGITVLDCEPHLTENTIAALDGADRIVLVTQLTIPMLRSAQRSLQLFARLGYRDEKTVVVVNRFRSADTVSLTEASTVLERPILATLANDFSGCSKAVTRGAPVIEVAPNSTLAGDFARLTTKVMSALTGEEQKPGVRAAETLRGLVTSNRK